MLPATLAQDIRQQVLHYLEATFHFRRGEEEEALRRFINDPEHGLFKGPWLQLRLPFRLDRSGVAPPFDLPIAFVPFQHQARAWRRLSSQGRTPRSTLVTTGTGSGKTECFLYPILDHCARERQAGRKGIKAIILYPMNALAADQAGRFAQEIFRAPGLCQGEGPTRQPLIRVGLYTGRSGAPPNPAAAQSPEIDPAGPGGDAGDAFTTMTLVIKDGREIAYRAITDHDALQEQPPDILLTNYKMLDFLLMRPKDRAIWRENGPGTLRYLVLDELHTYDGAQGADVACLIRRLKERLDIPRGELCCVGTSATLAGGEDEASQDPLNRLAEFAGRLFEEDLRPDCVLTEDRLTVEEVIRETAPDEAPLPDQADCQPREGETAGAFARRLAPLFGAPAWIDGPGPAASGAEPLSPEERWALALGDWLRRQPLFHALLRASRNGPLTWTELVERVAAEDPGLRAAGGFAERGDLLQAFIALVARAREWRSGKSFPLTPIQAQLWVRELRRLGRFVSPETAFGWLDERRPEQRILPVAHCTECGESVWVALADPDSETSIQAQGVQGFQLIADSDRIYQGWGFERAMSPQIVVLSPWREDDEAEARSRASASAQGLLEFAHWYLASESLVVRAGPGPCPLSGAASFRVKLNRDTRETSTGRRVGAVRCPHCLGEDTLMFIGARAATLGSVAIDELFGSVLNNDPKLLAFTDSVQDASHRAGFFSARTYHFTLRTALQRIIDAAGPDGLPLVEVGRRLLDYWSAAEPGRPGSLREAIATLLPPDLREYPAYLDYRRQPAAQSPEATLRADIEARLTWEATSEFGLMLSHGRTLEGNASATLGWDEAVIETTLERLLARLPGIDPTLLALNGPAGRLRLRRWLLGVLHRQRDRGGLHHPYLDALARQNYWGKFPFGRVVKGRETHPPAGRYKPRLLAFAPHRDHDAVQVPARPGQLAPWHLVWAVRALELSGTPESSLLDLLRALLEAGLEAGLFREVHRDGGQRLLALAPECARLHGEGALLECSYSGALLYRPWHERSIWEGGPVLAYRGEHGVYRLREATPRQVYYQRRYRKGALRRVFAREHTGLLTTPEREALEYQFNHGDHADDPNVLTATSTLEMGIDIGDLSSTLLCSIPPSTASYVQRIGRAGRSTGAALVLAVINQRPHDLFFFGRPQEMLAGRIEPPGCWLDASAVIVRQFLAFCFDSAVKTGVVETLPATGQRLVEDLDSGQGPVSAILGWLALHEAALRERFLARFLSRLREDVREDTRERFFRETRAEVLRERIHAAARDFDTQRQALANARKRLADQKQEAVANGDREALREIEQEGRILKVRQGVMGRVAALELLIEYGLLPNYAFPERGVHFNGIVFNEHRQPANGMAGRDGLLAYDLVRGAGAALRELAPRNHFYTHSREFEIQQVALGSPAQPLLATWAICGACGHMRRAGELNQPGATPVCPQCGHAEDEHSQLDLRQRRQFLEFSQSQAISYMEHYESLSGDRAEERAQRFYKVVRSFDTTLEAPSGAVADTGLPFGIEYRAALALREVNTGFAEQPGELPFGVGLRVSDQGFVACAHCGITLDADLDRSQARHRRSCSGRRKTEKRHSEGRTGDAYQWESFYLYRELRSEAIRILLPEVEEADVATLTACIHLGLRLRFQGNPAHLMVIPQKLPQHPDGLIRHYLVLMDAVPGGTGFLKTLFQTTQADRGGLPGEGFMDLLRRARDALESCQCRMLGQEELDGCYRCIRTYHLQYQSELISRERGIQWLNRLIEAGEKRVLIKALDQVDARTLFGSLLEKRFVDRLREFVETSVGGQRGEWTKTIIKGAIGFRFRLAGQIRTWELELQPRLGPAQGIAIPCQPDFLLGSDDPALLPLAIFADGFEPHVRPDQPDSRLPDDLAKRRAIQASGVCHVWAVTWNDLHPGSNPPVKILLPHILQAILPTRLDAARAQGAVHPDIALATADGFSQLTAYLSCPDRSGWMRLAHEAILFPLQLLAGNNAGLSGTALQSVFEAWKADLPRPATFSQGGGDWVASERLGPSGSEDLLALASGADAINGRVDRFQVWLRLPDASESRQAPGYLERWRHFLALANLFQFCERFIPFVISECHDFAGPVAEAGEPGGELDADWRELQASVVTSLTPFMASMAMAGIALPEVEVYLSDISDCCAELGWRLKEAPGGLVGVALLVGDQATFATEWQQAGWRVITLADIHARGAAWLLSVLPMKE